MSWQLSEADSKLALAVIASATDLKVDNEKLVDIVGGGTTANAIRQRVWKLTKQAKSLLNGEEPPAAKGKAAKSTTPATPKAASKRKTADSPDPGAESPSKKRATPAAKGRKGNKDVEATGVDLEEAVKDEETSSA